MKIERIPIENRAQWLALRKFDVTASTIGAIFGAHPYVSPLRLFLEKQGLVEFPEQADTAPMRRGRILESAVAAAVAEDRPEWRIVKATDYYRDPDIGIGATPDYFVHGDPRGLGNLQIKTALPSVYERDWSDGMPPLWITLQTATEMMLTDAAFGAVAVMVLDPHALPVHIVEIPRHAAAEQRIIEGVKQFWTDIENGEQPDVDYGLDKQLLKILSPHEAPDKAIDLSADNEVIDALAERAAAKEQIKVLESRCEQAEALLMSRMGDAARAMVPGFSVSWKTQNRKGYEVAPSTPRVLLINPRKGER